LISETFDNLYHALFCTIMGILEETLLLFLNKMNHLRQM